MSSKRQQSGAQSKRNKGRRPPNFRTAVALGLRDIFIASINKGQLPIFGVIFLMAIILIRMPAEDLSKLAFSLLEAITNNQMSGYILAILIAILWFGQARKARKEYTEEFRRIGREKSKLQGNAVNTTYQSSDNI